MKSRNLIFTVSTSIKITGEFFLNYVAYRYNVLNQVTCLKYHVVFTSYPEPNFRAHRDMTNILKVEFNKCNLPVIVTWNLGFPCIIRMPLLLSNACRRTSHCCRGMDFNLRLSGYVYQASSSTLTVCQIMSD